MTEGRKIKVDQDYVDVKNWKSVYGEAIELEGTRRIITRYFGTCPRCCSVVLNDETIGTYADPEYWNFCPNCGADMRKEIRNGRT